MFTPVIITKVYILDKLAASLLARSKKLGLLHSGTCTCTRDPNMNRYTVWTAWISIRVRVRAGVYFILQNLSPPGTTVHVPTAGLLGLTRRVGVPRRDREVQIETMNHIAQLCIWVGVIELGLIFCCRI